MLGCADRTSSTAFSYVKNLAHAETAFFNKNLLTRYPNADFFVDRWRQVFKTMVALSKADLRLDGKVTKVERNKANNDILVETEISSEKFDKIIIAAPEKCSTFLIYSGEEEEIFENLVTYDYLTRLVQLEHTSR